MSELRQLFDSIGSPVLIGLFILLFILETRYGLRERKQPRTKRLWTNSLLAVPSFILLRLMFLPVMMWIATKNETWRIGINYLYDLSFWIELTIAVLILDYANYLWHILNHRIGLLWRFHLVHHADLDLDVTTAIRFHFGELLGSVIFRGFFVFITGASVVTVLIYEIIFEAATLFHHSNLRLPFQFEKFVNKVIVTPRMHGIHHSDVEDELNSNFSTVFSIWDKLHRTLRLNIPQKDVVIGIPAYNDRGLLLDARYLLLLPFKRRKPLRLRQSRTGLSGDSREVIKP